MSATEYLQKIKDLQDQLGTPVATEPTATPQPNAEAIARKFVGLGGHVIFFPCGTKRCTTPEWQKLATNDVETAVAQAAKDPFANVGLVGKENGLWALDDDGGLMAEYEKKYGPINTYTTSTVSGGRHLIFRQNAASWAMGNISVSDENKSELLSARINDRYVVLAGSWAHPNNDETKPLTQYTVVDKHAPVVEAPESLLKFIKDKEAEWNATRGSKPQQSPSAQQEIAVGGRNNYLASRAGSLRNAGASYDSILLELQRYNERDCKPALDDKEVEAIAKSYSKYEEGKPNAIALSQALVATPIDISDWRKQFKSVGELEDGEPRMLIRNFLPEGTIFIGALAGEGKTLLGLSIAKALTTGKNFLGQYDFSVPEVVPVLYLIPESGGRAFRKRCETFQIPDDPKLFLARTISEGGTLLLNNPWVLEAVKEMKPVVILDTLIRFSEADDENQASQNKQMVDDIIRLRQAGATAVIGMHHATKAMREKGMSLETALRGTGDIAAAADAVYGMLRDSKLYADGNGPNEIDVACLKPRDFEPPKPFRIAASGKEEDVISGMPLVTSVIDQLHDFRVVSQRTKAANLDQKIAEMIAQDPTVSRKVLADETGVSEWEIRQAVKRMGLGRGTGGRDGAPSWRAKPSPTAPAA
jgi:hypothetical protein